VVLNSEVRKILNCDYSFRVRGEGGSVTLFTFQFFTLLVKLSVEFHMGSNTLVLQSYLHKFDTVRKE